MKFKEYGYRAFALLVVWALLLGAASLIDDFYGTITRLVLVAWICIGICIMLSKKIDFPLPEGHRIDLFGAFRMLWWAIFWPRYLTRK